jgi:type I restriction-modification system DNA methylase subunit
MAKAASKNNDSSANIGFKAKLWLAANKLRNNMDAAEYKHVVLGLIFIKYISNAFKEIATHGYALPPGHYVGAEEIKKDGTPFKEKIPRLIAQLAEQYAESTKLKK